MSRGDACEVLIGFGASSTWRPGTYYGDYFEDYEGGIDTSLRLVRLDSGAWVYRLEEDIRLCSV